MKALFLGIALTLAGSGATACARTTGARPDDMSVAGHRKAAADHRAEAARHRSIIEAHDSSGSSTFYPFDVYTPYDTHALKAMAHKGHAKAHERAAAELEEFEEAECGSFPAETRSSCPLVGRIVAAEDVPAGIRIRLSGDVSLDAAVAHMRCHSAFGRSRGRTGMPACPFYVKGVTVEKTTDGRIDLLAAEPEGVAELRTRARELLKTGGESMAAEADEE